MMVRFFSPLVESHHHAVVPVPDAAFAQRPVEEGALLPDDDLLEAHLPLLYLGVLVVDLRPHGLGEARELVVVAYHLELVAGEEGHLAIGDVDALAAAEDAAHVDAEILAEVELRQLLAGPKRVFGHLAEAHVDLAVEQSAPRRAAVCARGPRPGSRGFGGFGRRGARGGCSASSDCARAPSARSCRRRW